MKQRGVFLIGLILITIYYFLFPRESGQELVITPEAVIPLAPNGITPGPVSGNTLAVHNGRSAGFISMEHKLLKFYESEKIAVDDDWIAVSGPGGLEIREPDGRVIFRLDSRAFPIARNGDLFLYRDDFGVLTRLDPTSGRVLWEKEYISPLTVLDSRADRSLVGLLDGRVQLVDNSGTILLEYRPGGSRVEAVYGGTLSSDASQIALISGLDPQRFILLEERKNGFRPVSHHNTGTDFRSSVPMGFVRGDRQVLYERGDSVASMELNGYEIKTVELSGSLLGWLDNIVPGSLIVLGRDASDVSIKMLSRKDLTVFEGTLPSGTVGIRKDRNYAVIVGNEQLAIMEFSVR